MDARLMSYLYCFNITRDYFECHEYGESLWLDSGRPVGLKGLIQAAVCLYHLENGNVRGAWRMWQRARTYLTPLRPEYESIDVGRLMDDIDAVFAQVPVDWRPMQVSPAQVEALHLPRVDIRITDPAIAAQLPQWSPEPLPDRD
jgi:predicted metal-dependent hydrolase